MAFEFRVNGRIARPVGQVFDAVVNPDQLSRYFVTLGGISGPLVCRHHRDVVGRGSHQGRGRGA